YYLLFFSRYTSLYKLYTLSLHDALPIFRKSINHFVHCKWCECIMFFWTIHCHLGNSVIFFINNFFVIANLFPLYCHVCTPLQLLDRKSTRLNSSHVSISYAVFCLKKKKY